MDMRAIFDRLMAFDTVSSRPNIDLMQFVRDLLADAGVEVVLIPILRGARPICLRPSGRPVRAVSCCLGTPM